MPSTVLSEIRQQLLAIRQAASTREFWIYVAVITAFVALTLALALLAINFDRLTPNKLLLALSCKTGEGQLATIIIGSFVFGLSSLFSLGEVTYWVEERRQARDARRRFTLSFWRPLLCVLGNVAVGASGLFLMFAWCF